MNSIKTEQESLNEHLQFRKTKPTATTNEFLMPKEHPVNPLVDNNLPAELRHAHGYAQLPKKFNILVTLFNEMEKILQTAYGREQRKTFREIATNVEKNAKRKFSEKHLAQIVKIYPAAYTLRWERPKERRALQLGLWELVVHPNLSANQDLAPFIDDYVSTMNSAKNQPPLPPSPIKLISPVKKMPSKQRQSSVLCTPILDKRTQMDAKRVMWRKLIFRHLLVNRVRDAHQQFLPKQKLVHNDQQSVHPLFAEQIDALVADIDCVGALPQRPRLNNNNSACNSNLTPTDIRTFLQSVKRETREAREKTPERSSNSSTSLAASPVPVPVCKSEPQTPAKSALKFEPITPKTPLVERLKAKFAINEAARNAGIPGMQKRQAILCRLEHSILEVIRAHLNLEQRFSVGLTEPKLLQKLGSEITAVTLLEHLRLLCEIVPSDVCWLDSFVNNNATNSADGIAPAQQIMGPECYYFKISRELGPKWVTLAQKAIEDEKLGLERKMHTLHRSPSNCF